MKNENRTVHETETEKRYNELTISILKWGSISLSAFAVIIGIISLFFDNILGEEPDKAVIWFGLAVIAILIPFVREITIKDIHVVLKDLKHAKESLDATNLTSRQLHARLTATRHELINGYQIYLNSLSPKEKEEKTIQMSELYIEEMGLKVSKIKTWLDELGFQTGPIDDNITPEYINGVIAFQKKYNLGSDGIFGYRTYDKICQVKKAEK